MVVAKNAMEVFSVLDKSNCRKCGEKTCLAFAGAVYMGNRRIQECPNLSSADISKFSKETDVQWHPFQIEPFIEWWDNQKQH